ncbi:MAG: hypothetical protein AB2421_17005 [Thermotaleaceae bacterium]
MLGGLGVGITLVLTFLIKFFFVVFIIGLLGGILVEAKNIFTPEDIAAFKAPFKSKKEKIVQVQEKEAIQ